MKQRITTKQRDELSEKGKERYSKRWPWDEKSYDVFGEKELPLLSIGQMIEFLDESGDFIYSKQWVDSGNYRRWTIRKRKEKRNRFGRVELCDTLWKATKEVLEK